MLADAPKEGSDYEKALYVFEKLIDEVDYVEDSADNQNIISAFLNHETICQGYAYATQYLLEKLPDDRMSDDELELLAPWNETVKAEIERRANESNQSYVNCQGAPATEK